MSNGGSGACAESGGGGDGGWWWCLAASAAATAAAAAPRTLHLRNPEGQEVLLVRCHQRAAPFCCFRQRTPVSDEATLDFEI